MLHFIIGGRGAGKRDRLLSFGLTPADIFDGETGTLEEAFSQPALDRLHGLVRRWMEKGKDPAGIFDEILKGDVRYLTCDEVGGGSIPMDGFEREYREAVGRLCCRIAAHAQVVERLYCGIPMVLKKNET